MFWPDLDRSSTQGGESYVHYFLTIPLSSRFYSYMSGVNAQAKQVEAMFDPVQYSIFLQSKHSQVETFSVGGHGISIPTQT